MRSDKEAQRKKVVPEVRKLEQSGITFHQNCGLPVNPEQRKDPFTSYIIYTPTQSRHLPPLYST